MDASYIIYTGVATPNIPISPGQNLQLILQHIDTAINNMSQAPDYSGYDLYCITETDGVTHPTNTQNFAEGISKIVCDLRTLYNTFTGTTYVSDQSTITTAITGLQDPSLTYSPFSITNTDSITTVWSKIFTGLTGMTTKANPSTASWSAIGIESPPTTVAAAFNDVIGVLETQTTDIADKENSIGTFDNSANCLGGTSTDSIAETINLLTTFVCGIPYYDDSGFTWGCVTAGGNLNQDIQNIISSISTALHANVTSVESGLILGSTSCSGRSLQIDTSWTGLYKTAVTSSATTGYLGDLITSIDGSITIDTTTNPDAVDLSVTNAVAYTVKVDSGGSPGYLSTKIASAAGSWGLSVITSVDTIADQLVLTPVVTNPSLFIQNFITTVSGDADLLAQFCSLMAQCATCITPAPSGLSLTITGS